MEKIDISELHLAGSQLFTDAENFLEDLTDTEAMTVQGGEGAFFLPYLAYGQKILEYGLNGFAIANIASIAKSFSAAGIGGVGGVGGGVGGTGVGAGAGTGAGTAVPTTGAVAPATTTVGAAPGLRGTLTYTL